MDSPVQSNRSCPYVHSECSDLEAEIASGRGFWPWSGGATIRRTRLARQPRPFFSWSVSARKLAWLRFWRLGESWRGGPLKKKGAPAPGGGGAGDPLGGPFSPDEVFGTP